MITNYSLRIFGRSLLGPSMLIAVLLFPLAAIAADTNTPAKTPQAWTLEEAAKEYQRNPSDVYLQFVSLQLALSGEESTKLPTPDGQSDRFRPRSREETDLLSIFSGALAVQESLQLDVMRGRENPAWGKMAIPSANTVKIETLSGPTVSSHPWDRMLAAQLISGKKPAMGPLDLAVPEDQYYLYFHSLTKMLEVMDAGDVWGTHFYTQASKTAKDQRTGERIKKQLAIQTDPLSRPFYDMVVEEAAVTGSDLFFREGSDVTVLFSIKQPEVFRTRMDGYLTAAEKTRPDAVRSTGKIGDVEYVSVTTPDRAIHAFSAYPKPNLHVRSNSKIALERILQTIQGGKGIRRLGDSTEFKYIRTLMPRGDQREDCLIYLSDPFIRKMVGPELKLTEQRRILCYNNLRMIGHGAMLYRTQYGKAPQSIEEMNLHGCLLDPPKRTSRKVVETTIDDMLECPCGGKLSLSADGLTGLCSHHGTAAEMIPCCEILLKQVTPQESSQYKTFVENYSQYWRQYFDPIVIRLQVLPKQYRAETIVLPLIDNSIYTGLAETFSGEPESLDTLPIPQRTILSLNAHVNKKLFDQSSSHFARDIRRYYLPGNEKDSFDTDEILKKFQVFLNDGIGNQIGLHIYDASPMFDFNFTQFFGDLMRFSPGRRGMGQEVLMIGFLISSLNSPVYASVPVKDPKIVDSFLETLDQLLTIVARQSRNTPNFFDMQYDYYLLPAEGKSPATRCFNLQFGPIKWRLFFARIENGLYVSNKRYILDDLVEASQAAKTNKTEAASTGSFAHATIHVRANHWKEILPDIQISWAEGSRDACLNNLSALSSIARASAATSGGKAKIKEVLQFADAVHGVHFYCPDGGKYEFAPDGKSIVCSHHGNASLPRQHVSVVPKSNLDQILKSFDGLTAELTFLEDGLHAVLTIDRK